LLLLLVVSFNTVFERVIVLVCACGCVVYNKY
jgi:hypothetical protein